MCTARPLCRTTHPCQKSLCPPQRHAPHQPLHGPTTALGSGVSPQEPSSYFCSPLADGALPAWPHMGEATTHPAPRHPFSCPWGGKGALLAGKKAASILPAKQGMSPKSPAPPQRQKVPLPFQSSVPLGCVCLCKTRWVPNQGDRPRQAQLGPLHRGMSISPAAAEPGHGQRRIPAGTHPWAPQQHQRPPEKAPAASAAPQAFAKKKGFFIERKIKTRIPLAATPRRKPPVARPGICSRMPLRWLCTPALSPCTPALSPRPCTPVHTYEQHRGLSGQTGGNGRPPAGSVRTCGRAARPWCAAVSFWRDVTAHEPSSPRLPRGSGPRSHPRRHVRPQPLRFGCPRCKVGDPQCRWRKVLCPSPGCGEGGQAAEKPHRCTQGLGASSGDACNARR